ncbi:hypothetical protein [Agromyces ramosus]|uniref:LytR cell envelope-related transcriptional attenuator n=1 Tax=Agromyces ramosus TaxID=33879 RepID=A0ABU0R525_9MICO|nr:hypothetical protein [Agromyces ramosus]MDQ0892842.1 hypothetical protein [Agromyces ramosus]
MTKLDTRTRAGLAIAMAGVSATLLTGCFANPIEDLVNQGVEGAVEDATGGDVSLGGELPADFPTSVPLVEGEVAFGAGAGGAEGWIVMITSTAADPVADAAAALEGAGFTKDTELSGGGTAAQVYTNGELLVLLAGEGETVSYTVTQQPQ